jgi:hypothetical protein
MAISVAAIVIAMYKHACPHSRTHTLPHVFLYAHTPATHTPAQLRGTLPTCSSVCLIDNSNGNGNGGDGGHDHSGSNGNRNTSNSDGDSDTSGGGDGNHNAMAEMATATAEPVVYSYSRPRAPKNIFFTE